MPFDTQPRERNIGTGRACRAIVAARLLDPASELRVFRALQLARFTTTTLFDTDEGIRAALAACCRGADAILAAIDDPATEEAYQADRAAVRTASGQPDRVPGQGREHGRRRPLHRAVAAVRAPRRAPARGGRLPAGRGLRRRDREPRPDAGPPRRPART